MERRTINLVAGILISLLAGAWLLAMGGFYLVQDRLAFHPTHRAAPADLTPWLVDGQPAGLAREAHTPKAIWLIMQGNAGQAGHRGYFKHVPADESLYILEYPGYGQRPGQPSRASIDAAAAEAYRDLRRRFPGIPLGVVGESFGSGPACHLLKDAVPPDRVVLFVPLARLDLVMSRYIPLLPLRWLLRTNWDNPAALRGYRGPVTIYAAENDAVIPRSHTLLLAEAAPHARIVWVPGGHNDTGEHESVRLADPLE